MKNVDPEEDLDRYIKDIEKGDGEGKGGMKSKLDYAQKAAAKNIPTYIANGKRDNVIIDIIDGKSVGTKVSL